MLHFEDDPADPFLAYRVARRHVKEKEQHGENPAQIKPRKL